jgi:hypothetical protein
VKAVQRMLGHASAALTLDIYAGLFADDLDEVADRLDSAARAALVALAAVAASPPPTEGRGGAGSYGSQALKSGGGPPTPLTRATAVPAAASADLHHEQPSPPQAFR